MLYADDVNTLSDGDYITLYYIQSNEQDAYFFFDGCDMVVMYLNNAPHEGDVFEHPEKGIELRVDKIINAEEKYFNTFESERSPIHIIDEEYNYNGLFMGL